MLLKTDGRRELDSESFLSESVSSWLRSSFGSSTTVETEDTTLDTLLEDVKFEPRELTEWISVVSTKILLVPSDSARSGLFKGSTLIIVGVVVISEYEGAFEFSLDESESEGSDSGEAIELDTSELSIEDAVIAATAYVRAQYDAGA